MTANNNSNINEAIKQHLTVEMVNEGEATFNMVADAQGIMDYKKIPLALKAMGMSLDDFGGSLEAYESDEIDIDKFLSIVMECLKAPNWGAAEMQEAFHLFDKDGNGYIDTNEVQRILARIGENLSESEVNDQLREYDLDGDMEMAVMEFYKMIAATKGLDFVFEDSQYGVST